MKKEVNAEIITIGDEILYGQIIDTNSSWIGATLSDIGIKVLRRASVGDEKEEILDALKLAAQRVNIVLITGGLGPTKDDITKHTLCEYFGAELIENKQAISKLEDFFLKRGRKLEGLNRLQALLPSNCNYIPNNYGTAPAMWFERDNVVYISMPGVPAEMKGIMTDEVIPKLLTKFETPVIYHKSIKTIGIGESLLAELINDWEEKLPNHIKLAYLPSMSEVKLRLTCHGTDLQQLTKEAEAQISQLKNIIPQYIYGYNNDELMTVIAPLLLEQKQTISCAESCTGGYLSHLITSQSGSSAYFEGSIIAYSYPVKTLELQVPVTILETEGAVSEKCIKQMAENVRENLKTDIGLATSGIAGPLGGTPDKPVGTVWIALASESGTITQKLQLGGSRTQNIHFSAIILLNLLRKYLIEKQ